MEVTGQMIVTGETKSRSLEKNRVTSSEELFRALVAEHQDMVLNTCYRFVMNREDAEDLAQDVFVEVHRSLQNFREESKLSTWIYRIAVTKSLDHLRRVKRKKRFSSLRRIIGIDDPAEELPSSPGDNPEQALAGKERTAMLQQALNTLPDNQKTAFLLSKQDGYSNSDIADILGTSVSAVESLIHRAKKNLHDKLARYYAST
jgi:RNA polymerase sigma-70 factor (ECF subfamily)